MLNRNSRAEHRSVSLNTPSYFLPSSALQLVVLRKVLLGSNAKILAISQAYTYSSTPYSLDRPFSILSIDLPVLHRGQQHSTDPSLLFPHLLISIPLFLTYTLTDSQSDAQRANRANV